MATRGNGLLFNIISTMKCFKLQKKIMSKIKFFLRQWLHSLFSFMGNGFLQSISHFKNYFNLFFFNDRKWINAFTNMSKSFTFTNPSISISFAIFGHLRIEIDAYSTAKFFLNPIKKSFIAITYGHSNLIVIPAIIIRSMFGNYQTSFSINNTSKINDFISREVLGKINAFNHKKTFCLLSCINFNRLNNKCQAAETNRGGTHLGEVIVRTLGKLRERGITRLSASCTNLSYSWS